MLGFIEFIIETKDAHKAGYQFHVLHNYPKGEHTIVATHPASEHTYSAHHLGPSLLEKLPKQLHNNVVGSASIYHSNVENNDHIHQADQVHNVEVHDKHRRNGVASAMYNQYKHYTGHDVIPFSSQSDDAKELWASRR